MTGPRLYTDDVETRAVAELRTAGRRLTGYAAVFDSPTMIGGFEERIARGAFAASLAAKGDILALVDHDSSRLLGRTRAGTLRLSEDARGLAYELDLPDTTLGRDVLALAERRDIGGMSFGFRVKPGGDHWPSRDKRELRAVDLIEISVVQAFPAYAQTSVAARSRRPEPASVRLRRLYLETLP